MMRTIQSKYQVLSDLYSQPSKDTTCAPEQGYCATWGRQASTLQLGDADSSSSSPNNGMIGKGYRRIEKLWGMNSTPAWMIDMYNSVYNLFGGVAGRRSFIRTGFFSPLRVALLAAIFTMACSWIGKQGCLQQHMVNGQWELITGNNRPFAAMCYSDIIVQFDKLNGFGVSFPFGGGQAWDSWAAMSMPLTKIMIYLLIKFSALMYPFFHYLHAPIGLPIVFYCGVCGVFFAFLWLGIVAMVYDLIIQDDSRSRLSVYLLALSPVAAFQLLTNFDVVPVFFTTLGLWCFAHQRSKLAGLAIGVGTFTSLSCAVILLAAVMLLTRREDLQRYLELISSATLTIIAGIACAIVVDKDSFYDSYRSFWNSHEDLDSLYSGVQSIFHYTNFDPENQFVFINIVVITMAVGIIVWASIVVSQSVSCNIYQLSLLLLGCFLVTGKMFKPQFSLWILPLLLLGSRRYKLMLIWMVVDGFSWIPRMGTLLGFYDSKGLTIEFYGFVAVVRIVVLFIVVLSTAMDVLGIDIRTVNSRLRIVHDG